MSHSHTRRAQPELAIPINEHSGQQDRSAMQLCGRKCIVARFIWIALVVFTVSLFVIAIPTRYNELQHVCVQGNCYELQLSAGDVAALQQLGLSLSSYATYNLPLEAGYTLVFFLVAAVIFWRRSDDWMAMFVSLSLVTLGATFPPVIEALARSNPIWRLPALCVQELAPLCLVAFLYLFPDGRFVPRWTSFLALSWALWSLVRPFFIQTTPFALGHADTMVLVSLFGVGAFTQIYRYRRISNPVQQQQTKWVVFGLTAQVLGTLAYVLIHALFSPLTQPGLAHILGNVISIPVLLTFPGILVPLTIGIAILRYHLWDIDFVINRTLVYGTLTAVLALVYFGSVVLLQQFFYTFTGQSSLLTVVASTLVIALLFQPLRHRIQLVIDQRFYHHKYDAAQALATFSARLQQNEEVNLSSISDDVLDIVENIIQPAHVSFWLCNSTDREENGEMDTLWENEPRIASIVREQFIAPSQPTATSRQPIVQAQWLPWARLLWLLLATLTSVLFIISLPSHIAHLHIVCADIMCDGTQSTVEVAHQLHSLGISIDFYAAYALTLQIVFALGYFTVAVVIFCRTWGKSNEPRSQWMALLVSFFLVTFVLAFTDAPTVLTRSYPALSLPLACLGFIGETSLPLCFYLLPDGRFAPRWTRWLIPGWIAWGVFWYFFPNVSFKSNTWFLLLEDAVFISGLGSLVFAQIYRYRYLSNPAQRQQTKWVVFGMVTGLGGFFGAGILGFIVPHALLPLLAPSAQTSTFTSTVAGIIAITTSYLAMLLVPLTIYFAIHRYRLWDVDALVSQTLIYSTLIGILGLIFLGSVITQERLLQALVGRASELLIVGSTLAIVLLFQPLRHRIQTAINRRLYRRKYVIEQTLAAFSTTLLDEVNLEQLSEDVMEVVEETMRPAQATLWLLQSDSKTESARYTRHLGI